MMERQKLPLRNAVWQVVAAFIVHSLAIQAGINLAYSTILLPQIMKVDDEGDEISSNVTDSVVTSELIVNKEEASWIASLVPIATLFGSLIVGPLMDRFGRKITCAFTTIPILISWTLVAITTISVYTIYAARFLAGAGGGLSTVAIVYVSEISHPSIRPMLLSLTSVFVSFGILLTSLLSYFLTWKAVAICCGAIALANLIAVLFIPESPAWIVGVRANGENSSKALSTAERSLKWLYKNPKDYQKELESLVKIKEQKNAEKKDNLFRGERLTHKVTIKSPEAWKPLVILFVLFVLQQFSGAYIVIFYAVQMFERCGSGSVDKFTSLVILGIIRFVMAIISVFLSKKYGRRPLLISSGVGQAVCVLGAASWLYFFEKGWFPVSCLLLYVFFASYGVTVIPWTLIGELLPLAVRGKGSGFMIAVAYLCMFITTKFYIDAEDLLGITWILVSFSAMSWIFSVFVYLKIPETFGKTFQEIENYFK